MASRTSDATPSPKTTQTDVALLPGARFFVRRIDLVAESPVSSQVELALEAMAPFPLEQMYYGYITDTEQRHALVYAAFRRNFSPEEQAAWTEARAVLPDFLVWAVVSRQSTTDTLQWSDHHNRVTISWDEASPLPATILCQTISSDHDTASQTQEIQRRTGVSITQIKSRQEPITTGRITKEGLPLTCGTLSGLLAISALAAADVRDKDVLAVQQSAAARSRTMLRVFTLTAAALAACLLLELILSGGNLLLSSRQSVLSAQAPEISRIESAQNLATRLEKLSAGQLKPFEMLAAINIPRPSSVAFVRVSTTGPQQLEVEAQTTSAGDMRNYEAALRKMDGIEQVELRDPRMRGGQTTFSLAVTFKPGWLGQGGDS